MSNRHPVDVHVGKQVRSLRKRLGVTQAKLAEGIGMSFQQVQKYETGYNRISCSVLSDIADFLGVSPGYFFESRPEHILERVNLFSLQMFEKILNLPEEKRNLLAQLVKDMSNGSK